MKSEINYENVKKHSFAKAMFIVIVLAAAIYFLLWYYDYLPEHSYSMSYFKIETIKSNVDFNNNGVDDYTDILLGARADAKNHPRYDSKYWETGYPPDDVGVCTDVIWRAFKNAGYSLRDMVDADIKNHPSDYPNIETVDNKIDFRRVINLHVFFEKYAVSLTNDITDLAQWQPGDIVIFGDDKHIGIISDKRAKSGVAYVIHNGGQPKREENYFARMLTSVTGHYRFDAELIDDEILVPFNDE